MSAPWLFLYLASLVQMLTLYRLDLNKPATLIVLLPVLLLPLLGRLQRGLPRQSHPAWLNHPALAGAAGLVSLASAVAMARILHLGFWDTTHLGVAVLCALVGLGLLMVVQASRQEGAGRDGTGGASGASLGLWIWIAAWAYTGAWHPVLPFLGAGLSAFLGGFGWLPMGGAQAPAGRRAHPFWTLLLLGLVLPKPWFDFNLEGGWAPPMAAFALAAGLSGLAQIRDFLDRLPNAALMLVLLLALVLYPSAWAPLWAGVVGFAWGPLWRRLPRPLALTPLTYGFLLGLLVSYALHSNLGVPLFRRLLWPGS